MRAEAPTQNGAAKQFIARSTLCKLVAQAHRSVPHFGRGLAAVHREAQPGQLLTQTPVHALADRLPALAARFIVAVGEGGLVVILLGARGGGQRREEQGGEAWHVALRLGGMVVESTRSS